MKCFKKTFRLKNVTFSAFYKYLGVCRTRQYYLHAVEHQVPQGRPDLIILKRFFILEALTRQIIIVVSRCQFLRTKFLWPVSQKAVKHFNAPFHCSIRKRRFIFCL
jgi:hypothetical protein